MHLLDLVTSSSAMVLVIDAAPSTRLNVVVRLVMRQSPLR